MDGALKRFDLSFQVGEDKKSYSEAKLAKEFEYRFDGVSACLNNIQSFKRDHAFETLVITYGERSYPYKTQIFTENKTKSNQKTEGGSFIEEDSESDAWSNSENEEVQNKAFQPNPTGLKIKRRCGLKIVKVKVKTE